MVTRYYIFVSVLFYNWKIKTYFWEGFWIGKKYLIKVKYFKNCTWRSKKALKCVIISFTSVQFSPSAMSDSLRPHESQHASLPVHHQLPEFTQTHVHRVSDAIQPSHPLSSPSPPALNPSQYKSLFQWVSSLHEVAKVLEFQL